MFLFRDLFTLLFDGGEGAGGGAAAAAATGNAAGGEAAAEGGATPAGGEAQQQNAGGENQAVPYERFTEVNQQRQAEADARQAAEQRANELQAQLTQQQRAGLPELERVQAQLADANAALEASRSETAAAVERANNLERGGWVRAAATRPESQFHDAEDALSRIDLSTIDTPEAAARAVTDLAGRAQHLIKPPANVTANGADMLQQILDRGTPAGAAAGAGGSNGAAGDLTPDEFNALTDDQLVAFQEKNPEAYERSLRAAAAA